MDGGTLIIFLNCRVDQPQLDPSRVLSTDHNLRVSTTYYEVISSVFYSFFFLICLQRGTVDWSPSMSYETNYIICQDSTWVWDPIQRKTYLIRNMKEKRSVCPDSFEKKKKNKAFICWKIILMIDVLCREQEEVKDQSVYCEALFGALPLYFKSKPFQRSHVVIIMACKPNHVSNPPWNLCDHSSTFNPSLPTPPHL